MSTKMTYEREKKKEREKNRMQNYFVSDCIDELFASEK